MYVVGMGWLIGTFRFARSFFSGAGFSMGPHRYGRGDGVAKTEPTACPKLLNTHPKGRFFIVVHNIMALLQLFLLPRPVKVPIFCRRDTRVLAAVVPGLQPGRGHRGTGGRGLSLLAPAL